MKPTIGRMVVYTATEDDKQQMRDMENCNVQDQLPAVVVAVWGDDENALVNLKVLLDGEGDVWRTSIPRGDEPFNWNWPVIHK